MPPRGDILLALVLAAVGVLALLGEPVDPVAGITQEADAFGVALALVITLPVAFRRRFPVGVLVLSGMALIVAVNRGYGVSIAQAGTVVALASAAYFTSRDAAIRIGATVAGVLTASVILALPDEAHVSAGLAVGVVGSGLLAVWIG